MSYDDLFDNDLNENPTENPEEETEKSQDPVNNETDIYSGREEVFEETEKTEEKNSDIYSAENNDENTVTREEPQNNTADPGRDFRNYNSHYQQPGYQQNPYRNPYQGGYSQAQYNSNYGYNQSGNGQYSAQGNYAYNPVPPKKSSAGKKVLAVLLILIMIIGSIGIGTAIGRHSAGSSPFTLPSGSDTQTTTGDNASIDIKQSSSENYSDGIAVSKKARGSVVGVLIYGRNKSLSGEGSGVVMGTNEKGTKTYIITCAHVIKDPGITAGILMEDGTVYQATIVGYDERTDIGVLSIEETGLEKAEFGDSAALQIGETVYAIGNPGGSELYGSVTNGIVSAVDRSVTSTYDMTYIQHTAAISPGNSGGALVNTQGQVVGINSSKIVAEDYEGISFAVPMSVAKPIVESLIAHGYVPDRPKLGISYAPASSYQTYSMVVQIKGLPSGSIIIASISDDSALKGTDVQAGDLITAVNGKKLTSSDIILDEIQNSKVGDKIKLSISRIDSRTYAVSSFEVTVELVEDKGSSVTEPTTEPTTQGFPDIFGGPGSDDFDSWEDYFNDFFN